MTLTLNEPRARNPLSPGLVAALTSHLRECAADPAVRAVVLHGAGTGFCAGADLRRMRAATPLEDRDEYDEILALNRLLWRYPKPTVAAVHGFALGAGANLMNWCDIAVIETGTRVGYPEVKAGVPSATVIPSLMKLVGRKRMFELVLTGRLLSADEAVEHGLATRLVPAGTALDEARQIAQTISGYAESAVRLTKEIVHTATDMSFDQGLTYAKEVRVISRLGTDFEVTVAQGANPTGEANRG